MGYDSFLKVDVANKQFVRVGKYTNSAGVEQSISSFYTDFIGTAANGDKIYFYLDASGLETILDVGSLGNVNCAIYDLYINGVQDSTGYDEYQGSATNIFRNITLTIKPRPGVNTIEARVNGKNASSSAYATAFYGMRLR